MSEHTPLIQSINDQMGGRSADDVQQALEKIDSKLHTCVDNAREIQLAIYREQEMARSQELDAKFQAFRDQAVMQREDIGNQLRSYVTATCEAHTTALMDQEKEQAARKAKSLNLRVVGLNEEDGENTQQLVEDFFRNTLRVHSPEVAQTYRVGKNDHGPRHIVVHFASLEARRAVFDNRSMLKGMKVWLDPDLTLAQVEDKRRELDKVKEAWSNGWVAYMKEGRAVAELLEDERVPIWTKDALMYNWARESDDEQINSRVESFFQFLKVGDLIILNGTSRFPTTRECTYVGPNGESLVDYVLASKEGRDRVLAFTLGQLMHESDHRPVCCTLSGFDREGWKKKKGGDAVKVYRDRGKQEEYRRMVEGRLKESERDPHTGLLEGTGGGNGDSSTRTGGGIPDV
ncbi:hypothetical protein R1sor_027227 [Riccia sorocarpa]|uniref:RRM domain-containing protein n=1 Tax=Riccia sorocarpa TaxID=122646 RepID=A0ABD3GFR9_9MARC